MIFKISKKFLILFLAFIFININTGENSSASASQLYEKRLLNLEQNFSAKDGERYRKHYADLLLSRAKYYRIFKKDYQNASIDTMSALYFLDENSDKYKKALKSLDKLFVLNNFDQTERNNLELAKALYYEKKYYAGAWLLENAVSQKYEEEICCEFLGDIAKAQNNPDVAIRYYLKSLEIYPKNIQLKMKLAKFYDSLGKTTLAQEQYRQILEFTTEKEIVDEIILIFNQKIQIDPRNPNNYELLGTAYSKLSQFDKTYGLYKKALEIKPNDVFLKYILAGILHELRQNEKAIEIYDSILDDDIYESQIRIGKAKCLEKLGKENEAIKEYQTVLIFYPNSEQAKYAIYKILKDKIPTENILASFYPLNDNFAPNSLFVTDFAYILGEFGQVQDAQKFYKMAIDLDSKNKQAYINLFNLYELSAQSGPAFELIKKASAIFPNDAEILNLYSLANKDIVSKKASIAQAYAKNNEYQKAIETYMQIEPKTPDVYFSVANCYQAMKDYSKTVEYYKKGLNIDPKNVEGLHRLAVVYFENNDYDNARIYLIKVLEVNRANLSAQRLLAVVTNKQVSAVLDSAYDTFEKKDYKKTNEILTNGLKKFPNDPQLYYYRALNYEAQKDYKNAIVDLKNSIKADPNFELAYFSLAQILEKTDSKKEALEAYERFLSGNSTDKELIKKAQERIDELTKKYY